MQNIKSRSDYLKNRWDDIFLQVEKGNIKVPLSVKKDVNKPFFKFNLNIRYLEDENTIKYSTNVNYYEFITDCSTLVYKVNFGTKMLLIDKAFNNKVIFTDLTHSHNFYYDMSDDEIYKEVIEWIDKLDFQENRTNAQMIW